MAERTAVTEGTQIGVETTPGTAVAAGKKLPSLSIEPSPKLNIQNFRPSGNKFSTIHALGKEWTEAKLMGAPTYSELQYPLASIMAYAAPAQQSSTTAYKWTHAPNSSAPDTIKTFTVERGSAAGAEKFAHGLVTDLTLSGTRDAVELSGSMIGQATEYGITMTSSPTALAQVPILAKEVSIYLDALSGDIGETKLLRVLKWQWALTGRYSQLWTVDAAEDSWVTYLEAVPTAQVKLTVEVDTSTDQTLGDLRTAWEAGSTNFLRIEAISSQLAGTAIPFSLVLDQAVQVADVSDRSIEDEVVCTEVTLDIVDDAGWGKALTAALINKATAL